MPLEANCDRGAFLRSSAVALIAADLATTGSANAQVNKVATGTLPSIKPGTHPGPADGPVIVLLHGWPYDIYAYVDVAPALASVGYRVIVPYLRGFGPTRFLSADTFRDGEQLVFALDTVALYGRA